MTISPFSMTRRTATALACATGLLPLAAPAMAQGYASRDVGGWTVAASKDGKGCFVTRTFPHPGNTTVLLGLDVDGANHLSVLNANWSIEPKERLKLDFRLSKSAYPDHFAVGMASDGARGFVTNFGARFPDAFAASNFLHISRGKVPVERLGLAGSGAAVQELRRCVTAQRRKPAAGAGESWRDQIPRDPFASRKVKERD